MTVATSRLSANITRNLLVVLSSLILCLLAGLATAAPLWHHVTVVSTEGWRFDDVTVVLAENADSLIVHHADSSQSSVALSAIESITDVDGNDITALVLDREVEKTERIRPGGSAEAGHSQPSRGYRFESALSFGAGVSGVTGFRFEGLRGDVAFEAAARIRVLKRAYFGLVYINQKIHNRGLMEYVTFVGWRKLEGDYRQHEFYGVIGGNSQPKHLRQALLLFELGAGFIAYDREFTWEDPEIENGDDWAKSEFSVRLAAAVIVPIDRTWGLMLGVNTRFTGDWLKEGGTTGTLIGAHLGLVYMIGT